MSTIAEIQDEIIEEFSIFSDWLDKYEHIIEMGKELPAMEESLKTEDRLVKGCQSQVWLASEIDDTNRMVFTADSDALISKGLIAMLVRILSHQPAEAIVQSDLHFLDEIGLKQHLSPNRSNGLSNMVKTIKLDAAKKLSKQEGK